MTAAFGVALATWPATAQQGIYTCVDAHGRRLTADRPIRDCLDREQKELNPSGTVRRLVGPSLSPQQRAAEEEKVRREAEERTRAAEEKKRDLALLDRYPDPASHARARETALQLAETNLALRPAELADERTRITARFDTELARLRTLWAPQKAGNTK